MSDIVVVCDTSVFTCLLMIGGKEQVGLVSVTQIRPIHGVIKHGRALILVETATIVVIKLKSNAHTFACIYTKDSCEMVFAIVLVAKAKLAKVCYGRQRVGE